MITNKGQSVLKDSIHSNVLLVFLRHFGCTFCREALEEIAEMHGQIQEENVKIILVHMSDHQIAEKYFQRYGLQNVDSISDPDCQFYKLFGLIKGTFNQLFGFRSWVRGLDAGIIKGHGWGIQLGDGFQMPGVFVIHDGKIVSEFKHRYASDKPNYKDLLACGKVNS
ncbi:MAG: AhpC/TSA family protein [Bacteroidota bacterium]|nr:AhpC/TSA family protein [Bacteroidota bacterium]